MPITNIIDHRKRPYRFKKINAVVEAQWHDNSVNDADQSDNELGGPDYKEREHASICDVVSWADSFSEPVTVYLYDEDDGIYPRALQRT